MIEFIIGLVLGFGLHYAIFCSKDLKNKCVKCYDFMLLKKKVVKANKKKKGKK
jgi:hypothetical protein